MTIKVILADDHAVVRDGIRAILDRKEKDIRIIGEAASGTEVLKMAKHTPADVYVLDISMPLLNGVETTDRLIQMNPQSKVIILSMHDDRTFVERALACGAKGYVTKESAAEELIHAIREVWKDRFFLSPKISRYIVQGFLRRRNSPSQRSSAEELTRRERQVLQLIAEGFSNKDIARELTLSLNTVHVHRNNLMRKLDLHKQADLIRYAVNAGLARL
jgi:two-component system response regulator NreC